MSASHIVADDLSQALAAERPRLVRLCRHWAGAPDVAEDLAQETLLEAWRLLDRLREPEGLSAWLAAIARNVCYRWARSHGRERAHTTSFALPDDAGDELSPLLADALALAQDDPVAQVERAEVASLLTRALAPLPDSTRALTLASVVSETPAAELAQTFGLSEGAVRVRLHRGRQALRRALTGELRAEAEALDLTLPAAPIWQESRIWCPFCGVSHLRYRIDRETGEYAFVCAGACEGQAVAGRAVSTDLVAQVSSPKSLLTRHCLLLATAYREALAGPPETCDCGGRITFASWPTDDMSPGGLRRAPFGIFGVCSNCGLVDDSTAWHLTLDTPEAQQFWRRYPRMRRLPMTQIERDNRLAIVTGFASADGGATLQIVSDAATYAVLHVETQGAM